MDKTIEEYLKKMSVNGRVKDTIDNTRYVLTALDEFKPIGKCKEADIIKYFEKFDGKESSKNLHKIIIKKFFKDAGKLKEVEWIRVSKVDSSLKDEDILNTDDINKLIQYAPNDYFKALIAFLWESGCRIGEAKKLTYTDFKLTTDGYIVNIPSVKTKNGYRKLILPMSTPYITNLKLQSDDKDFVFKYVESFMRDTLKAIGKEARINKPISPHKFRHARATEDARSGYSEQILKKKFGWTAGSKMPDRYTHLTDTDVMDADKARMGQATTNVIKPIEVIDKPEPLKISQTTDLVFELESQNKELREDIEALQQQYIKDKEATEIQIEEIKKFQIEFFQNIKKKYNSKG